MNRRLRVVLGLTAASFLALAGRARAEILVAKPGDGWELYTFGRVGVFVNVLKGDGIPQAFGPTIDPATGMPAVDPVTGLPLPPMPIHNVVGGGVLAGPTDPILQPDGSSGQGPMFVSRVRSGFLGNIFGLGVRRALTERTRAEAVFSIWGTTETEGRRTFYKNYPDWREAYIKIEGPAGTVLVGRALSLFSRGAVEINFQYGHQFGVGNPAGFDERGPTAGHIGYGVIAPVFVAGVGYATPKFHGLQLTVAYYDPATTVGIYWGRTKFGRPEAEVAYDLEAGRVRMHLFASGAWQKLYSLNLAQDDMGNNIDSRPEADVIGGAGGARVEVGPVHLGVAGHRGKGLGIGYFLDGSEANFAKDTTRELRMFSGLYVQAQVVAGKFDLNAGWGMTKVDALTADINKDWCLTATNPGPCRGFDTAGRPAASIVKSQMGISGVVVYHATPNLHLALDYFNSNVEWQQGEKQMVHSFNAGSTLTW